MIATRPGIDWENDGFQAILLGENSNVLSQIGAQVVTDITLDEFSGAGYGRQTLQNTAVVEDVGEQVRFTADNVSFNNLGNGPSRARWVLIAKNAINDAARIPIFVVGRALGPIHPNGGDITIPVEAIW